MNTITLNKQVALNNNTTLEEILCLLIVLFKSDVMSIKSSLIEKGYITADRVNINNPIGWIVTKKGGELLDIINVDSDKNQEPENRLIYLATQLKEIFPKGKKPGTNYYWAEGIPLIIRRLKIFFKKYGHSFTNDQILNAAKNYINGFNGDYQYMKLLKYFIFKEKVGIGGDIEGESELINYIENEGQEDSLNNNWQNTLI